ncbi:ATP synthase F0F1 subunit epsilon [Sulfitobacter guttiformis]|uniref:ATP synthase epsilon chain n=1 Tax=Sulfitobacter guttiformis TaxID=74349 RepID=A0A420DJ99_9RHOB|nr:ATP synthase F0F1 subunit epsilon [Sulfitobacter guttiformis]KIN71917.1 F0F1 ATP synthase subunit epsilon [Sulfitobacter guttiformis KCTC 32187]RKE94274.1 F-type H+-transporting ATPase subunit epsilon [Sulfitobacter guttiformis]
MRLSIVTPLDIIVDETIHSLRAEDASGSFGILPYHAPFLTALAISIVSWRSETVERFCAVRGGALTVTGGNIAIATREAVVGDDLAKLDTEVLAQFQADADAERVEHVETLQLQMNVIRRMVSQLSTGADAGKFR